MVDAQPGALLRRYLAGEHEAAWAEMTAAGPALREDRAIGDAWAVAQETMRRARRNVETIIRRLDRMGYRFWNGRQGRTGPQPLQMMMGGKVMAFASAEAMLGQAMRTDLSRIPADMRRHAEQVRDRVSVLSGLVQGLQKQQAAQAQRKAAITDHLKDEVVFSAPMKEEIATVRRLEKEGLILPLSLRAWVEEVGHVNLSGEHPALCFWASEGFPGVYADPLMIFLDHFILESEASLEKRKAGGEPGPIDAVLGWDAQAKARLAVEDEQLDYGYSIALPNAGADASLQGEKHNTTFVNYLRLAFRWGGFPGWEQEARRPERELKFLTEGLLPI